MGEGQPRLRHADEDVVRRVLDFHGRTAASRFSKLRAWAAGKPSTATATSVRDRLMALVVDHAAPAKADFERAIAGAPAALQAAMAPLAHPTTSVAEQYPQFMGAVLFAIHHHLDPDTLQASFDRWRANLVARLPILVPDIAKAMRALDVRTMMASLGYAVSMELVAPLAAELRGQQDEIVSGLVWITKKLQSAEPIDVVSLLDAALDDLDAYRATQEAFRAECGPR